MTASRRAERLVAEGLATAGQHHSVRVSFAAYASGRQPGRDVDAGRPGPVGVVAGDGVPGLDVVERRLLL